MGSLSKMIKSPSLTEDRQHGGDWGVGQGQRDGKEAFVGHHRAVQASKSIQVGNFIPMLLTTIGSMEESLIKFTSPHAVSATVHFFTSGPEALVPKNGVMVVVLH